MYADNHLNKRVNESENDLTFTESESEALKYVLVSACEDFKETLLEELNICEKLINGEISIDEMLQENIYESEAWNKLKSIVQKGAEKVKDNVESIKSKIKEINDFIKGVLNNAIKSVKEMGAKIIEILKKFGCSLNELFKKIGLNEKECEEEFLKNGQAIAQRVEDLKKDNVYETLGIQIKQDLINEADANAEPNKDSKVVSQEKGKGWKKMLWHI
jgi:ASC-1-like (ASCH) protein